MTPRDWEKVLLEATERVRRKVTGLSRGGDRDRTVGVGASGDTTILADKEAEDEILASLRTIGGVRVLSEEAGEAGDPEGSTLAIVDPLDGSSNFERGIPFYCTSVAMVEGDSFGDITFGVVRDLVTGDVYSARRGEGARKNGRPMATSRVRDISLAVAGVDLSRCPPATVTRLAPLVSSVKRQVHFGANALEICYLAEGSIDAFVDLRMRIRITDIAAAYLIASEAGAVITDEAGEELKPRFELARGLNFVASANRELHSTILGITRGDGSRK